MTGITYIITTMDTVGKFTLDLFCENVETEISFDMNPIKRKLFKTSYPVKSSSNSAKAQNEEQQRREQSALRKRDSENIENPISEISNLNEPLLK